MTETESVFDGERELRFETVDGDVNQSIREIGPGRRKERDLRLKVRVRRQVETVEARVTLWQLSDLARFLEREPTGTVRTLQVLEPVDRDATRARRKLQQTRFLLGRPALDCFPEPLHDLFAQRDDQYSSERREGKTPAYLVSLLVSAIIGVFHPIVDVNLGHSTDEKL